VREVVDPARRRDELPLLVFLQGGPGGKSPRPGPGNPPWLVEALKTHRVLLPDQRGTGRSTRIESATMAGFADGEAPPTTSRCSGPTPSSPISSKSAKPCSAESNGNRSAKAMAGS
jgi:pimeloyl-ACP methyl ester carboxylesterase